MMRIQHVAAFLRAMRIPVRKVTEGNDIEDGEIEITDNVHVQVASAHLQFYMEVGLFDPKEQAMNHYGMQTSLSLIHRDIVKAMEDEKKLTT